MGDLNELQATEAVRVVGSTTAGAETTPLAVDTLGSAWVILRDAAGSFLDPRQIRALTSADIVTANQGTPNTAANAWLQKLTDGTNVAKVTTTLDLQTDDRINTSAVDTVLALTTAPAIVKVGGSVLTERKYVILEGLSINIKWGFSNSTQSFDLFKNQLLMVPVGPNVNIWMKVTTGTGSAGIAEGA